MLASILSIFANSFGRFKKKMYLLKTFGNAYHLHTSFNINIPPYIHQHPKKNSSYPLSLEESISPNGKTVIIRYQNGHCQVNSSLTLQHRCRLCKFISSAGAVLPSPSRPVCLRLAGVWPPDKDPESQRSGIRQQRLSSSPCRCPSPSLSLSPRRRSVNFFFDPNCSQGRGGRITIYPFGRSQWPIRLPVASLSALLLPPCALPSSRCERITI